jgi:hypothetical protein
LVWQSAASLRWWPISFGESLEIQARLQGRRVEDHGIVDGVLVLVFEAGEAVDPGNVMAFDSRGRLLWRKSSWVRRSRGRKGFNDPYVAIGASKGELHLYTGSCHRVTVKPRTGTVTFIEFTR